MKEPHKLRDKVETKFWSWLAGKFIWPGWLSEIAAYRYVKMYSRFKELKEG